MVMVPRLMKIFCSASIWYLGIFGCSSSFIPLTQAAVETTTTSSETDPSNGISNVHGVNDTSSDVQVERPSLAAKYSIQEPKLVRTNGTNTFRLDYPISSLITTEFIEVKLRGSDCKEELDMKGGPLNMNISESLSNDHQGGRQLRTTVVEIDFVPENYHPSWFSKAYWAYLWTGGNQELRVCLRFMIFNQPPTNQDAVEVNFKESIIILDIASGSDSGRVDKTLENVTIEHVEPVGVHVHVMGDPSLKERKSEEESPASSNSNTDKKKKLRDDLIQQKLKEMLERDKKQREQQQRQQNQKEETKQEGDHQRQEKEPEGESEAVRQQEQLQEQEKQEGVGGLQDEL